MTATWQSVIDSDVLGTDDLDWRIEVSERLEEGGGLTDADFGRLRALIVRTQAALAPGAGNQVRLAYWLAQLDAGVREIRAWEASEDRAAYLEHVTQHPSRRRVC